MKEFLGNQYKNIFLWSPFVLAFGAALYFSLDSEPDFQFPILITLLLGLIILFKKNIIIRAIALFFFGFFYSMSFTHITNTPQIKDSFGAIKISGTVKNIDFTNESTRLFVQIPINQIDTSQTSDNTVNIRMTLKEGNIVPNPGDTITGKAMIFRPSGKFAPASFDFARWAYFSNISGTGFFTEYNTEQKANENINIRNFIHNKTKSKLTDALFLGYKQTLSDEESTIWKSIGLGHVWSISGFHMTLIGTWLFMFFYFIFRCIASITKRIPAKYPAMLCAWVGLFGYLLISGINVATIRAFLMTTLIFLAAILGRNVLSLRNAAIAFIVIFLINPFFVMNAGFQLSFAAIFGILWFFRNTQYTKRDILQKILHTLYTIFMTTLIATFFTLPFIIAHFGYIPLYSLIGNIIILPIFSFVIMPLTIFGTIFALFGNQTLLLDCANTVYEFALHIAKFINNLPVANLYIPHISNTSLILCIIGMLCIILIINKDSKNTFVKNINYVLGSGFITMAIIINLILPKPLFYSTTDHQLVGFVYDNQLKFNKSRSSNHYFAFETWRKINNEKASIKNARQKCKDGLCIYKTKHWNLAYMQKFTTIMDNAIKLCEDKNIDFIVSPFDVEATNCHAKILKDGILIYPYGNITTISNHRPWHNQPAQNTDQMTER